MKEKTKTVFQKQISYFYLQISNFSFWTHNGNEEKEAQYPEKQWEQPFYSFLYIFVLKKLKSKELEKCLIIINCSSWGQRFNSQYPLGCRKLSINPVLEDSIWAPSCKAVHRNTQRKHSYILKVFKKKSKKISAH